MISTLGYEYSVELYRVDYEGRSSLEDVMNEFGKAGWKLHSFDRTDNANYWMLVFERERR